ncbi:MAG: DNA translocase FtsK [Opitutales bacterium]|nr:DNA translocase FtsK [Opitutales bacterium]
MAKPRTSRPKRAKSRRDIGKTRPTKSPSRPRAYPVWALLCLMNGILVSVALAGFEEDQTRFLTTAAVGGGDATNPVGAIGADAAYMGYAINGLAVWLFPLYLIWFSGILFFRKFHQFKWIRWISFAVTFVALSGLLSMVEETAWRSYDQVFGKDLLVNGIGGYIGRWVYSDMLKHIIGPYGSVLILSCITLCALLYTFIRNVSQSIDHIQTRFSEWLSLTDERKAEKKAQRVALKEEKRKVREEQRHAKKVESERKKQATAQAKSAEEQAKIEETPVVTDKAAPDTIDFVKDLSPPENVSSSKKPNLLTHPPRFTKGGKMPPPPPPPKSEEVQPEPEIKRRRMTLNPFGRNSNKAAEEKEKPPISTGADPEEDSTVEEGAPDEISEATIFGEAELPVESESVSPLDEGHHEGLDHRVRIVAAEKVEREEVVMERRADYQFPPMDLLMSPPDEDYDTGEDHLAKAQDLKSILDEFKVKITLGDIHTGPVITRYEVTPAPGVRVEKIASLDKNIALGLRAEAVRILAPVPGKGVVGVEVPNRKSQPVCLRDIIESKVWNSSRSEIPIALGKEVSGKPIVADLTKMPHLLIAGSTGSGKTVCINAVIASLLYKYSPEDLRFIMVDPKIVEMQAYNALPHMLIPVVTEPKKVPGALKWLLGEMERRYHMFAQVGVRNIAGFNARLAKNKKEEMERAAQMDAEMTPEERAAAANIQVQREPQAEFYFEDKKLPYIVCIIDELADLMMVAPADIETGIARLAQLARAAGIHLIIATQRPSVNVITGVIKANLPSRISFRVSSKVDSRTILDQGGAEALIGKGDMLFTPPGSPNMVRAQGAFVSDEEINGIVEYLKVNGPPQFLEEAQTTVEQEGSDGGDSEAPTGDYEDEMIPKALDVLKSTKRASASMLQRRLRVGYNRAARVMEELEDLGIVGPENGSSPREILVDLDNYQL